MIGALLFGGYIAGPLSEELQWAFACGEAKSPSEHLVASGSFYKLGVPVLALAVRAPSIWFYTKWP